MVVRTSKVVRIRAKELRQNQTVPEKILWSILRNRGLGGLKFRRQHPFGPYLVDFYCAEVGVAVEVDGESHNGREAYDEARNKFFRDNGIDMLPVSNDDVFGNLDGVGELILQFAFDKVKRPLP